MKPFVKASIRGVLAVAIGLGAAAATSTAASAYTACNRFGDCWHTDARVTFPGISLTFHNDSWWRAHEHDKHYTWHEFDNDHDWHHGYWNHGTWHSH